MSDDSADLAFNWARANRLLRMDLRTALAKIATHVLDEDVDELLKRTAADYPRNCNEYQKKTLEDPHQRNAVANNRGDTLLLLDVLKTWWRKPHWVPSDDFRKSTNSLRNLRNTAAKRSGAEMTTEDYNDMLDLIENHLKPMCFEAQQSGELWNVVKETIDNGKKLVSKLGWGDVWYEIRLAEIELAVAGRGENLSMVVGQPSFLTHHCGPSEKKRFFLSKQLLLTGGSVQLQTSSDTNDDDDDLMCSFLGAVSAVDTIVMLEAAARALATPDHEINMVFALRMSAAQAGYPFTLHVVKVPKSHSAPIKPPLAYRVELVEDDNKVKLKLLKKRAMPTFDSVHELLCWARDDFYDGANRPYVRLAEWTRVYAGSVDEPPAVSETAHTTTLTPAQKEDRRAFLERVVLDAAHDNGQQETNNVSMSFVGLRSPVDTMLLLDGSLAKHSDPSSINWLFAVRCSMSTPNFPFTVHMVKAGEKRAIEKRALRVELCLRDGNWALAIATTSACTESFSSLRNLLEYVRDKFKDGLNEPYKPDDEVQKLYKGTVASSN